VDGCEVTYLALEPEELFFRAFRYHDFDVAELSFNSYLMTISRSVCPYVAIPPAFVSRTSGTRQFSSEQIGIFVAQRI